MTRAYLAPVPFSARHGVDSFDCRSAEQTRWLREFGLTSQQSGSTRVSVVTERGSHDVVAYYAWAMAGVAPSDAPARLAHGGGRYPQPMALLARLGVAVGHEGVGLGGELLREVMLKTVRLAAGIGCRGLVVHCENDHARAWYERRVPAFEQSPTDPLHLAILTKDMRRALGV